MSSEPRRRFILRLATALLTRVIGPVYAWDAWRAIGLLVYALLHTGAKWALAHIAKRNPRIANFAYRHAPAALAIASIGCFVSLTFFESPEWQFQLFSVIALPILLGGYEGAYWASFHGIDKVTSELNNLKKHVEDGAISEEQYDQLSKHPMTPDYEQLKWNILREIQPKEDRTKKFQRNEIFATIAACILILLIEHNSGDAWKDYANLFAFIFALGAWILPIHESMLFNGILRRMDRAPVRTGKLGPTYRRRAMEITGAYGMMQISVTWAMRFFALSTGDVSNLVLYITVAEFIGWGVPGIVKFFRPGDNPQRTSEFNKKTWIYSHALVVTGALIMAYSMGEHNGSIFLLGWALAQAAIRGATRPLEVKFASEYLCPKYQNWPEPEFLIAEIGIRERIKFDQQARYMLVWPCALYLHLPLSMTPADWMIYFLLLWSAIMAITGLVSGQRHWTHPPDARKDSIPPLDQ